MIEQAATLGLLGAVSAIVGGIIGRHRHNTVAGVLYGALLGPIGWWIVASARPRGRS